MTGVVYNDCYGGFSLSRRAVELGRELSGDPAWGEAGPLDSKYDAYARDVCRHDPVLVDVVSILGPAAGGESCDPKIKRLRGNRYFIDEYDGVESVIEPADVEWVEVQT